MTTIPSEKPGILFIHAGAELYGADRNILRAIITLAEAGYNCILMVPNDGPLIEKARQNGVKCIIENYPILRREMMGPAKILKYLYSYFCAIPRIRKHLIENRINIIHSNTLVVMLGACFYKKKELIHIWHLRETIWKPEILKKILYGIVKKRADRIICVSQAVRKALGPCTRATVINNGIEPIMESPCLDRHLEPKSQFYVGTIGRFNAIKGQIDLAKAARHIRSFSNLKIQYHFTGGVFNNNTYWLDLFNQFVNENKLSDIISVQDFTSDIKGVLSKLDLFVLPSTSPDSFPTVVLESMSAGVPVVSYRNGGVEEILDDDENCLVKLGDYKALGDTINRLLNDNALRYKLAEKQNARFRQLYSLDVFKKRFLSFYEALNVIPHRL